MKAPPLASIEALIFRVFCVVWLKVLDADQWAGVSRGGEEEEESTESLVCAVLSALQTLGERLQASQKVCSTFHMKLQFDSVSMGFVFLPEDPGAMLDEAPELVVSQTVLHKLLTRDELQTPRQHLQMYNSPINICASAGTRRTNVFS